MSGTRGGADPLGSRRWAVRPARCVAPVPPVRIARPARACRRRIPRTRLSALSQVSRNGSTSTLAGVIPALRANSYAGRVIRKGTIGSRRQPAACRSSRPPENSCPTTGISGRFASSARFQPIGRHALAHRHVQLDPPADEGRPSLAGRQALRPASDGRRGGRRHVVQSRVPPPRHDKRRDGGFLDRANLRAVRKPSASSAGARASGRRE